MAVQIGNVDLYYTVHKKVLPMQYVMPYEERDVIKACTSIHALHQSI